MNDIDTLMQRIDEINAKAPQDLSAHDIDDLVAYHRRQRARKASGEKAQPRAGPQVDLSAIRAALLPPKPKQDFSDVLNKLKRKS